MHPNVEKFTQASHAQASNAQAFSQQQIPYWYTLQISIILARCYYTRAVELFILFKV